MSIAGPQGFSKIIESEGEKSEVKARLSSVVVDKRRVTKRPCATGSHPFRYSDQRSLPCHLGQDQQYQHRCCFQWETFGSTSSEVQSVAKTSGLEAAKRHWLDSPLFASAMENPQLAVRLKQMVTDYSGVQWVNKQSAPPLAAPPIEQLSGINLPTLVIVGERDLPDFQTIAEVLSQRISNASKVVMSGVGHMSNMEDPARFNEIVLGFLGDRRE